MSKVPASKLRYIPFPKCAASCMAIEVLGAGECQAVCGYKFGENQTKSFTPEEADKHWNIEPKE